MNLEKRDHLTRMFSGILEDRSLAPVVGAYKFFRSLCAAVIVALCVLSLYVSLMASRELIGTILMNGMVSQNRVLLVVMMWVTVVAFAVIGAFAYLSHRMDILATTFLTRVLSGEELSARLLRVTGMTPAEFVVTMKGPEGCRAFNDAQSQVSDRKKARDLERKLELSA